MATSPLSSIGTQPFRRAKNNARQVSLPGACISRCGKRPTMHRPLDLESSHQGPVLESDVDSNRMAQDRKRGNGEDDRFSD
ncbi:TPA: hypothetical protein QDC03_001898 [Burkholderia cepacia]|uniref:hypothetical protein n=1 Tax=Burkholderia cepacia TaxID=292 RepID=UPI0011B20741|nr:hypothetical protein [Burkholderia cepacia]HDR9506834.1 hypothetical protein [Burkholderia cepacia]